MKTYSYEGQIKTIDDFTGLLEKQRELSRKKGNRFGKTFEMIDIAGGKRVLDVGCNVGYNSILLHDKGFDVTGIDLFGHQIEIANDLKSELKIGSDRLRFRQMDFLNSEFPSDSFDYALFLEVIEHVKNPADFLSEFARVLRPGGYLILSTPNALNTYAILKQLYPTLSRLFKMIDNEPQDTGTHLDHIYSWDVFSLYRLLHRSGFNYVQHEFIGLEVPFVLTVPFKLPLLSRFSRSMIFKVQNPV